MAAVCRATTFYIRYAQKLLPYKISRQATPHWAGRYITANCATHLDRRKTRSLFFILRYCSGTLRVDAVCREMRKASFLFQECTLRYSTETKSEATANRTTLARGCFQMQYFAPRARKTALFAKGVYSYGTRPEKKGPFDADIG